MSTALLPLPPPVLEALLQEGHKLAVLASKKANFQRRVDQLELFAMDGSIPDFLKVKCQKATKFCDGDATLLTTIMTATVAEEKTSLERQLQEIEVSLNSSAEITSTLDTLIANTHIVLPSYVPTLRDFVSFVKDQKLVDFNAKQKKDQEAKAKKQARFELTKAAAASPAIISQREHKKLLSKVDTLSKSLSSLQLKTKSLSGKAKGKRSQVQIASPKSKAKKSTGAKRKGNGNSRNTPKDN